MGVWSQGYNTTTERTTIALQKQGEGKSIKKSFNKPMAPHLVMITSGTAWRPFPEKITLLLKNILEKYGDKYYHVFNGFKDLYRSIVRGGEVFQNFTAHFFCIKKGLPKETIQFAKYCQFVNLF